MSRYYQRYRILSIYYSPAVTNYLYKQHIVHRTTYVSRHRLSCGLLPQKYPILVTYHCALSGEVDFLIGLYSWKSKNCNARVADMHICKRVPASFNKVVCPLSRKDNVIKVRKMALSPLNKTRHCS